MDFEIGQIVKSTVDYRFYKIIEIDYNNESLIVEHAYNNFVPVINKMYWGCYLKVEGEFLNSGKITDYKQNIMEGYWDVDGLEFEDYYLNAFFYNKMHFCGCGDPESNLLLIGQLLFLISKKLEWDERTVQLNKIIGNNERVHEFFLQTLDSLGLLEHGGSVWGSWLSTEGIELLEHFYNWTKFQEIKE